MPSQLREQHPLLQLPSFFLSVWGKLLRGGWTFTGMLCGRWFSVAKHNLVIHEGEGVGEECASPHTAQADPSLGMCPRGSLKLNVLGAVPETARKCLHQSIATSLRNKGTHFNRRSNNIHMENILFPRFLFFFFRKLTLQTRDLRY